MTTDPFHPVDDTARQLLRDLLAQGRHAALGVIDAESGAPVVTRIALAPIDGVPHTLVSDLSGHTAALRRGGIVSLLIGEPGRKGDPLTHPRLTLQARPEPADKAACRARWLAIVPKARLYYDFADFHLFRLVPLSGLLNGGFGNAWRLGADDFAQPPA